MKIFDEKMTNYTVVSKYPTMIREVYAKEENKEGINFYTMRRFPSVIKEGSKFKFVMASNDIFFGIKDGKFYEDKNFVEKDDEQNKEEREYKNFDNTMRLSSEEAAFYFLNYVYGIENKLIGKEISKENIYQYKKAYDEMYQFVENNEEHLNENSMRNFLAVAKAIADDYPINIINVKYSSNILK